MKLTYITKLLSLSILLMLSNTSELTATEYRNILHIYNEYNKVGDYLWCASGRMPEGLLPGDLLLREDYNENCHNGNTCIRIGVNFRKNIWMGVYWLPKGSDDPKNPWKVLGVNLYEALQVKKGSEIKLTFWTRGERGGEKVQFKVGSDNKTKVESIHSPIATSWINLSTDWKQYEINLSKENLSNVISGFCFVTNKSKNSAKEEIVFFLDDIQFEAN